MKLKLFRIPDNKLCNIISQKELLNLIIRNNYYENIKIQECNTYHRFMKVIDTKLFRHCRDNFDEFEINVYLFDGKIVSSKDKISNCDGFAYYTNNYNIVVSCQTDILSVLCHEISHIVVDSIIGHNFKDYLSIHEYYVEMLEYILSNGEIWEEPRDNNWFFNKYQLNFKDIYKLDFKKFLIQKVSELS